MKKISLVELSQMKDKPKEIIFNKTKIKYSEAWDGYYFEGDSLVTYVKLYELNLPLIEIEEEPILTDEERAFLETYVRYNGYNILSIRKIEETECLSFLNGETELDNYCYVDSELFSKMVNNKAYSITELGL